MRLELDAAARAAAEIRLGGLRALAEQAVLVAELDRVLDRDGDRPARDRELAGVRDRMLAHIASCGLEIVHLEGAGLEEVAGAVEVDAWRFDDAMSTSVVARELEAAVSADGVTLRRGRVVAAGPGDPASPQISRADGAIAAGRPPGEPADGRGCGAASRTEDAGAGSADGLSAAPQAAAPDGFPAATPAAARDGAVQAPRIRCPIETCGAENEPDADACVGCLTPLAGFARLTMLADLLFNRGLRAARAGESARARECFAAVVAWHPDDAAAVNAHALACLDDGDPRAARRSWRRALALSPEDGLARRGLAAISSHTGRRNS